ncbi:bulb-type lectin domain-containing protein [Rathayibacter tanaceti]|nr:amidase domain-containing protein [Rathayibacter tanaceti]QHC56707.1 hypothetical protein GSU10_14455 [Rathayibacter tanaceti]
MQSDGNFVVYQGSTPTWNSGTNGNPGAKFAVQTDGNLVVYKSTNAPTWSSGTDATASKSVLTMQNDGNLVLYSEGNVAIWSSRGGRTGAHQDLLVPGRELKSGQYLSSYNNRYKAQLQASGSLVVSDGSTPVFSTKSSNSNGAPRLAIQGDANLVIYGGNNAVLWTTSTQGTTSSPTLRLRDDGELVILASSTVVVWSSRLGLVAQDLMSKSATADLNHRNAQSLQRASPQISSNPVPTGLITNNRRSVVDNEDPKLNLQRDLYVQGGEIFTSFSTTITLSDIVITASSATATIEEATTVNRSGYAAADVRSTNLYTLEQKGAFQFSDGLWKLDSLGHESISDDVIPVTILPSSSAQAKQASGEVSAKLNQLQQHLSYSPDALKNADVAESLQTQKSEEAGSVQKNSSLDSATGKEATSRSVDNTGYAPNRAAAIQYALDHARNRASWLAYKNMPNDCANFVSQALFAGGWPMHSGNEDNENAWFGGPLVVSDSWGKAQELFDYGYHTTGRLRLVQNSSRPSAGDLTFWIWADEPGVKYTFDHASIVTAIAPSGVPLYSYHTFDNRNKSLVAILTNNPNAIYSAWSWG